MRAGLHLLEQQTAVDKAKVEWLRGAAQEAIDSLERGEGVSFHSMHDLSEHIRRIGGEVRTVASAGMHDV